jgi:plastocyanin
VARLAAIAVLVAALITACSDDSSPEGADGSTPSIPEPVVLEGDQVEILAVDNAFDPPSAQVAVGTEVTWRNTGRNEHNVIPEDEDAEWRIDTEDFQPGDEGSFTFDEPGTYRFYCSIHGTIDVGMPGVLVVE